MTRVIAQRPLAAVLVLAIASLTITRLFVPASLRAPTRRGAGALKRAVSEAGAKQATSASTPKPETTDSLGAIIGAGVTVLAAGIQLMGNIFTKKTPKPVWDPRNEAGVNEPLGYFDPLRLAKDEDKFRAYRTAEIKHGRVAMMATVGAVAQHYVKLPGFESVPSGLGALDTLPSSGGLGVLALSLGFVELIFWKEDPSKEPGNFGDPAGWNQTGLGEEGSFGVEMRDRELNNGRFAMFAIAGIVTAEMVTGKDAVQQLMRG